MADSSATSPPTIRSPRSRTAWPRTTWPGWKALTEPARRQDPAGRRRSVRHQRQAPGPRASRRDRQFDPGQGQPDRDPDRDHRRGADGADVGLYRGHVATARARPRIRPSPTSRSLCPAGRSRPAAWRAPTAPPSTTSCCGSRKSWAIARAMPGGPRSRPISPPDPQDFPQLHPPKHSFRLHVRLLRDSFVSWEERQAGMRDDPPFGDAGAGADRSSAPSPAMRLPDLMESSPGAAITAR